MRNRNRHFRANELTLTEFRPVTQKWISVPLESVVQVLEFKANHEDQGPFKDLVNSFPTLKKLEDLWAAWAPLEHDITKKGMLFYFSPASPGDPPVTPNLMGLILETRPKEEGAYPGDDHTYWEYLVGDNDEKNDLPTLDE